MGRKGIRLIRPNMANKMVERPHNISIPILAKPPAKAARKPLRPMSPTRMVEQRDSVFIVGGGPSLKDFDFGLLKGFDVISINSAIFHVPISKYFMTCDYTYLSKIPDKISKFVECNGSTKIFVVNMWNGSNIIESGGAIKDQRFGILYDLKNFDVVIKSRSQFGIGYTLNDFRSGGNSGFCGLQMAVIMQYHNIYLLGIDLTTHRGSTHFHKDYKYRSTETYDKKLKTHVGNFKDGITDLRANRPNVNVVSCSSISSLNGFIDYKNIEEVLDYERNKAQN